MTYEELHAEMVAAMKAKDKVRLGVARLVLGELKNAASRGGAHEITEEEVTAQIKRTLKQTNETLEMYLRRRTTPPSRRMRGGIP